jgi:hypothetical protein
MKARVLVMTGVFALTMLALTQVAQAQQVMVADIPFSFVAGNATLPAGEYRVGKLDLASHIVVLRQRQDPGNAAMIPTNAAQASTAPTKSKLVFHRYGERYFLSEVWTEGNIRGRQLMKSAAEKETAKLAKLETKGQVTIEAHLISSQP